ncbi:MAG: DUF6785 family protein [Armatimonadota bacterium]|nr:hypothetical protein [Armatimonadota bacterium]MCX7778281.1 hypothetical protein [Armatimonadota bacterium]MDW8026440.1 DUF6785 family protein [Armatimonadota bacterium]
MGTTSGVSRAIREQDKVIHGVRGRIWFVGLIFVFLLGIVIPYSDLVMKGTWVGLTSFPIASFTLLFAMTLFLNPPLRALGRGLSQSELIAIFAMALVSAGIPSFGLTGLLIPYIAGPHYFASPENRFGELILPNLPKWLAPQSKDAIKFLYEGLPPNAFPPFVDWVIPLSCWLGLILPVYTVFFCLAALLRKQWVENEKLVFPLVHLPVQMTNYEDERTLISGFFRNRTMWAFFLVPFALHTFNGLHFYIPQVPYINTHRISLDQYFSSPPWNAIQPFWVRIPFSIIGLSYLLPAELAFSLFAFYFFFLMQQIVAASFGIQMRNVQAYPVRSFVAHQMIGGILLFGIYTLWNAREHLVNALKISSRQLLNLDLGRPFKTHPSASSSEADDKDEAMPFSVAYLALFISIIAMSLWGYAAGAGFVATLALFSLYFVVHIVAVRLVCEGGMLYVQHPFRPWNIMLAVFGSQRFSARQVAILTLFDHLFMLDNRSPLMPCIMQSLKLGNLCRLNLRMLTLALALSVFIAIVSSFASYLWLMYRYGGMTLHPWFTTYYTRNLYCAWTAHLLTVGEPPSISAMVGMIVGAATMMLILLLHRSFMWFPLHPIGYLMGASWPMINFWFPIMVGWALKVIVMRFGGARLYRQLIHGFLGLIMAEFSSAGLWTMVDFVFKKRGHEIFSF